MNFTVKELFEAVNPHNELARKAITAAGFGKHLTDDSIEGFSIHTTHGKTGKSVKIKSYGDTLSKNHEKIIKHLEKHFGDDAEVSWKPTKTGHENPTIYVRVKNKE